jgi:hypothetical protein
VKKATKPKEKLPAGDVVNPRKGEAPVRDGTTSARRAKAAIREVERLLTSEEMTAGMHLSRAQMHALDCIASGLPVRDARNTLAAIRTKLDFALARPELTVGHRVAIQLVKDPFGEEVPPLPPLASVPALLPGIIDAVVLPALLTDPEEE